MIELANLALAGGLAAAAAPLVVHLLHRRKHQRLDWGAMRFLQELVARSRRRLAIENLLLLLVRCLAIACLALALTRPQASWGRSAEADRIVRPLGARVAAVLLVDDSRSAAAKPPGGEPALQRAKALALAYLDTLSPGDEVSIVAMSRLHEPPEDPIYDLQAARERIQALEQSDAGSDVAALLEGGCERLLRHLNPHAELVLVGDAAADGWEAGDRQRWDAVRRRLRGAEGAAQGSRERPHLVLLAPEPPRDRGNAAVAAIRIDREAIPTARPVAIRVEVLHVGASAPKGALLRLAVDGRPVGERPLEIAPGGPAGGTTAFTFTHAFAEPGSHVVEALIEGARDLLPGDDRRCLAVEVETRLPVLLVEGSPARDGQPLGGSLGLVAAALEPGGSGRDLFSVARLDAAGAGDAERLRQALERVRVAVLGDVPALDAGAVAALERFVAGGGGLLVVPGPRTDREVANRFWYRRGDGFLPCDLGAPQDSAEGQHPVLRDPGHAVLAPFGGRAGDAFREVRVQRWLRLPRSGEPGAPHDLDHLVGLDAGDPLLVLRSRGNGRVALFATALDGAWTELPYRPAFVPLVRSLVAHLAGHAAPARNLPVGGRLVWFAPEGSTGRAGAEGPDGAPLPLESGTWEGRAALVSQPLAVPGAYLVRDLASGEVARYAVQAAAEESLLVPLDAGREGERLLDLERHRRKDAAGVQGLFAPGSGAVVELWRPLVCLAVALLLLEVLLLRRQAGSERRISRGAAERLGRADPMAGGGGR